MTERITRNAAQCNGCGVVLESTHRHDFKVHECTQVIEKMGGTIHRKYYLMVDGGLEYIRRGFQQSDDFTDLSEYYDE